MKSVLERFLGETGDRKSVIVYSKVCAIVMLFLEHLMFEEILPEPPVRIQRPRRVRTEIRTFAQSEILRLRDFVVGGNHRVPAFFILLADTGIRAANFARFGIRFSMGSSRADHSTSNRQEPHGANCSGYGIHASPTARPPLTYRR